MKFTKEDAAKELRKKLAGNNSIEKVNITERSVLSLVEYEMSRSDEDMELTEFVEKNFPQIQVLDGQLRKDYADFIKSNNNSNSTQTQTQTSTQTQQQTSDQKTEYQILREELDAMKKEREEEKGLIEKKSKLSEIKNLLTTKGVKDDEFINDFLSDISISKDTDIETVAERGVRMFNKAKANVDTTQTPAGGGGGKDNSKQWDDVAKARKQQLGITED